MPNIGTLIQLPKLKTEVSSEIKRPIQNLVKHLRQTELSAKIANDRKTLSIFIKTSDPATRPSSGYASGNTFYLFIYLFIYLL